MKFTSVLFDVGDTLLNVPRDPHEKALAAAQHLGQVVLDDYKKAILRVQAEWQDAGGLPEHEDLPQTWVGHTSRALQMLGFCGDVAVAAPLIEQSFLTDGWEVYPEVVEALSQLQRRAFAWELFQTGRPLWKPRSRLQVSSTTLRS